jgi:hypothetical protein
MHDDDGYTLFLYFIPLNYTFKAGKIVNFTLYVF